MTPRVELKPEQKPYRPFGTALQLFQCKDPEVLLSGPAGTGKSRANLEKLHLCAEKYPGMRALILRKTRESLTQSALVTFEEKVVPSGHAILGGPKRNMRQSYRYPNSSEIVIGGLDKSEKVMSTEYDMAYIQEAIEVSAKDWENVTTRLRNNMMPYQQIIADTNPSSPEHWLYKRCRNGKCTFLDSKHEENPVLWDMEHRCYTPVGAIYLSKLDALSGVRFKRLRQGLWVSAEGMIFEDWDNDAHMVDHFYPPDDWPRIWGVDFGFTNPFVWQNWVVHPDNILILHQEIYMTHILVEDIAEMILDTVREQPEPIAIICDHDAEDRATLQKHLKMSTKKAHKAVSSGIQAVNARLKLRDNGIPGIRLMRDARVHPPDSELEEAEKPTCTANEIDGYVWDITAGQKKGDQPVKENDHGCDTMRYVVAFHDRIAGGGTKLHTIGPRIPTPEEVERQVNFIGWRNKLLRESRRSRL